MNIFKVFKDDLIKMSDYLKKEDIILKNNFSVEQPKDNKFGDLSTNIAMISAKDCGKSPRDLGEILIKYISEISYIKKAELAGPGFINVFVDNEIFYATLQSIIDQGTNYGDLSIGNGIKINVEYVSANPTGPMHVGHASGACYGDSLALILQKAGFEVTKEYYVNDAGSQINVLAKSCYFRYLEALGEQIEIPDGCYPGDYLIAVGVMLKEIFQDKLLELSDEERLEKIKPIAIDFIMNIIKEDLAELGIQHDVFTSELSLQKRGMIERGLQYLDQKGLLYRGVLEQPKGKTPEDWEEREQLLFKSTEFGDDVDRAIVKSDGSYTYFAGDIGLVLDKIDRGYDKQVYILGADHIGYISRLNSLVGALSDRKVECVVQAIQLVNLMEDGKPFKMSKRAGTFVTARDVIDMVGKDIIRIMMISKKSDMSMNFDIAKLKEQSKDNPVFYISYAHARAKSILRLAETEFSSAYQKFINSKYDLLQLSYNEDIAIIKKMAAYPKVVEQAAIHYEPHRIVTYAFDLAGDFHNLWAKGRDDHNLRFIVQDNEELTASRLVIARGLANIIASAMLLCNVAAPDYM